MDDFGDDNDDWADFTGPTTSAPAPVEVSNVPVENVAADSFPTADDDDWNTFESATPSGKDAAAVVEAAPVAEDDPFGDAEFESAKQPDVAVAPQFDPQQVISNIAQSHQNNTNVQNSAVLAMQEAAAAYLAVVGDVPPATSAEPESTAVPPQADLSAPYHDDPFSSLQSSEKAPDVCETEAPAETGVESVHSSAEAASVEPAPVEAAGPEDPFASLDGHHPSAPVADVVPESVAASETVPETVSDPFDEIPVAVAADIVHVDPSSSSSSTQEPAAPLEVEPPQPMQRAVSDPFEPILDLSPGVQSATSLSESDVNYQASLASPEPQQSEVVEKVVSPNEEGEVVVVLAVEMEGKDVSPPPSSSSAAGAAADELSGGEKSTPFTTSSASSNEAEDPFAGLGDHYPSEPVTVVIELEPVAAPAAATAVEPLVVSTPIIRQESTEVVLVEVGGGFDAFVSTPTVQVSLEAAAEVSYDEADDVPVPSIAVEPAEPEAVVVEEVPLQAVVFPTEIVRDTSAESDPFGELMFTPTVTSIEAAQEEVSVVSAPTGETPTPGEAEASPAAPVVEQPQHAVTKEEEEDPFGELEASPAPVEAEPASVAVETGVTASVDGATTVEVDAAVVEEDPFGVVESSSAPEVAQLEVSKDTSAVEAPPVAVVEQSTAAEDPVGELEASPVPALTISELTVEAPPSAAVEAGDEDDFDGFVSSPVPVASAEPVATTAVAADPEGVVSPATGDGFGDDDEEWDAFEGPSTASVASSATPVPATAAPAAAAAVEPVVADETRVEARVDHATEDDDDWDAFEAAPAAGPAAAAAVAPTEVAVATPAVSEAAAAVAAADFADGGDDDWDAFEEAPSAAPAAQPAAVAAPVAPVSTPAPLPAASVPSFALAGPPSARAEEEVSALRQLLSADTFSKGHMQNYAALRTITAGIFASATLSSPSTSSETSLTADMAAVNALFPTAPDAPSSTLSEWSVGVLQTALVSSLPSDALPVDQLRRAQLKRIMSTNEYRNRAYAQAVRDSIKKNRQGSAAANPAHTRRNSHNITLDGAAAPDAKKAAPGSSSNNSSVRSSAASGANSPVRPPAKADSLMSLDNAFHDDDLPTNLTPSSSSAHLPNRGAAFPTSSAHGSFDNDNEEDDFGDAEFMSAENSPKSSSGNQPAAAGNSAKPNTPTRGFSLFGSSAPKEPAKPPPAPAAAAAAAKDKPPMIPKDGGKGPTAAPGPADSYVIEKEHYSTNAYNFLVSLPDLSYILSANPPPMAK